MKGSTMVYEKYVKRIDIEDRSTKKYKSKLKLEDLDKIFAIQTIGYGEGKQYFTDDKQIVLDSINEKKRYVLFQFGYKTLTGKEYYNYDSRQYETNPVDHKVYVLTDSVNNGYQFIEKFFSEMEKDIAEKLICLYE